MPLTVCINVFDLNVKRTVKITTVSGTAQGKQFTYTGTPVHTYRQLKYQNSDMGDYAYSNSYNVPCKLGQ